MVAGRAPAKLRAGCLRRFQSPTGKNVGSPGEHKQSPEGNSLAQATGEWRPGARNAARFSDWFVSWEAARSRVVGDITLILEKMRNGDAAAADELVHRVYAELRLIASRKLAREAAGQTLQPTALVHEAWLRLGGAEQGPWQNRAHFFGAAAEAMRRILVDQARHKATVRRGGEWQRVEVNELDVATASSGAVVLAVHEALERLAEHDPTGAKLVELRYFAGMSHAEAGQVLGLSERTAKRAWAYARAWLCKDLKSGI